MSYLPSNITDCICNAGIALEKSSLVLGDLTTDYSFSERPAIKADGANYEALTLIWEYNRLFNFMEIAHDYICEAKQFLEHAEEIEKEQKIHRGGVIA